MPITTNTKSYIWPNHFPEHVPPEEAIPANGDVYRLVNHLPPSKGDFLPYREEHKHKKFTGKQEALSYGVSFFDSLNEIIKKRDFYKNTLGDKKVVTGTLAPDLGVMLKTFNKHHITVWLQEGSKPWDYINIEVTE